MPAIKFINSRKNDHSPLRVTNFLSAKLLGSAPIKTFYVYLSHIVTIRNMITSSHKCSLFFHPEMHKAAPSASLCQQLECRSHINRVSVLIGLSAYISRFHQTVECGGKLAIVLSSG